MILDTTGILSGIATAMFVAGRATCGQVHAAYPKVYTTRAQRPLGKAFVCSQRICATDATLGANPLGRS